MFDPAQIRSLCNMPEGSQPIALLCVGHVEAFYPAPMLEMEGWDKRRLLSDIVFEDSWGNGKESVNDIVGKSRLKSELPE